MVPLACAGTRAGASTQHATATTAPPLAEAASMLVSELLDPRSPATTAAAVSTRLTAGMSERERLYIGLDLVTMDDCIDRLIAAVLAARQHPNDAKAQHELRDAEHLYFETRRDAAMRLWGGPATCLPLRR